MKTLYFFSLLLVFLGTHPILAQEYVPDANTLALWHFNETSGNTIFDVSGNGNNGSAIGTSIVDGRFGKCRLFNGLNDRILVGNPPSIASLTDQVTVEAWVYPDECNSCVGGMHIVSSGNVNNFVLMIAGHNQFMATVFVYQGLLSHFTYTPNNWYHVALTYNGSLLTLYINGVVDTSVSISGSMNPDPLENIVTIGAYSWFAGISSFFKGKIDEARISNRARTPDEFNLQLPPKNLTANSSGTTINLHWENGGGLAVLSKYKIYRGIDTTNTILIDSSTSTSYADSGRIPGKTYYYRVSALDSTGFEGNRSYAVSGTTVGLVAYYPFNGNANDESGNGYNGVIHGPVLTSDRFGLSNRAFRFNGTSDYIEIPNTEDLNFQVGGFTLACWVRRIDDANPQPIIGKHIHGFANGYDLSFQFGELSFHVDGQYDSIPNTFTGSWRFIVGVYTGTDAYLYVDARFKKSQPMTYNHTNSTTIKIGSHNTIGYPYYFKGEIDDARIYNRVLTSAEIDSLYHENGYNEYPVVAEIKNGWNMISIPLAMDDYRKVYLFPTAVSGAFQYQGSYIQKDTLQNGGGYWLKYSMDFSQLLIGTPILCDTVSVNSGWNMIGSIAQPISTLSIVSMPPGIVTSQFFKYGLIYTITDTIHPGYGYWVKVNQSGKLILDANPLEVSAGLIKIFPIMELPPQPPGEEMPTTDNSIPKEYALEQAYPNPFNPSATIRFELPEQSWVTLRVYNLLGQEVSIIVNETRPPGKYTEKWDGGNHPSGIYYYRLQAGNYTLTRKMIYVR